MTVDTCHAHLARAAKLKCAQSAGVVSSQLEAQGPQCDLLSDFQFVWKFRSPCDDQLWVVETLQDYIRFNKGALLWSPERAAWSFHGLLFHDNFLTWVIQGAVKQVSSSIASWAHQDLFGLPMGPLCQCWVIGNCRCSFQGCASHNGVRSSVREAPVETPRSINHLMRPYRATSSASPVGPPRPVQHLVQRVNFQLMAAGGKSQDLLCVNYLQQQGCEGWRAVCRKVCKRGPRKSKACQDFRSIEWGAPASCSCPSER